MLRDLGIQEESAISRLIQHLQWEKPDRESQNERLSLDVGLPPREEAIYLLHVAAEVEHALLVQYLYAAYSLGGPQLDTDEKRVKARQWRDAIAEIAREEMGHLATVQNVLTLLDAPLAFERQEYPFPRVENSLYPFPFELERLTRESLGKYVLAEMPSKRVVQDLIGAGKLQRGEIQEIEERVGAKEHVRVHRVGVIYEKIAALFQMPVSSEQPNTGFIRSEDLSARSVDFQVRPSEWRLGYAGLIIANPSDRDSARSALVTIDAQGEGLDLNMLEASHFGRFLKIYREFPEEKNWRPARALAKNPTTNIYAEFPRRITDELALEWARLLNLRYRMLLMLLSHSFQVEGPPNRRNPKYRGLLISWAFGEMYNLRSIADILTTLPQHQNRSKPIAGPPFEMPYSLALAPREAGRWRQHRDLFIASENIIGKLNRLTTEHRSYLASLSAANKEALDQISALLRGLYD